MALPLIVPPIGSRAFVRACAHSEDGYGVFFVVFIIIGAFVMLNLYIAVVMDNFSQSGSTGKRAPSPCPSASPPPP
jgi:hypothetical protein